MLTNVRQGIAAASERFAALGHPLKLFLKIAAASIAAMLLVWLFDKIFWFYLTKSYVEEVAAAFDINKHLASAISWLTFAVILFLLSYVVSFSRIKRRLGILAALLLLAAHSGVVWYGSRAHFFDRSGRAIKCYVVTRDSIIYGERPGIDPATGRDCKPVTPEIVEKLKAYESGRRPERIKAEEPIFFDRGTGNAIVWFHTVANGEIEIFDLMGFHPTTGKELRPITAETVDVWKNQRRQASRLPPKRTFPTKDHPFFDPLTGKAIVWYRRAENGEYEFYDRQGFHPRTGEPFRLVSREVISEWERFEEERASTKCYVITKETVLYRNTPGIDPETGRLCRLLTPELIERLREYEKGRRAERLTGENPTFFDNATGNPIVWYYKNGDDIELFDLMGFHPQYGDELVPVTKEIAGLWSERQKKNREPKKPSRPARRIESKDLSQYNFFDLLTGEPRAWFWRSPDGEYEFYDGPGFHPRTGDPLLVLKKEHLEIWIRESEAKKKAIEEELERKEREKQDSVKKEEEDKKRRDAEQAILKKEREKEQERQTQAARLCDQRAANPNDTRRVADGVTFDALRSQVAEAIADCENAIQQNPNELRFRYQLARALQYTDRQRAFVLHQGLVSLGYPAAHDNLGWIYLQDKRDPIRAVNLFRKGVLLGDPDSMVSLAEMMDRGHAVPQSPGETKIALYRRAAQLGHAGALKALQVEEQKEGEAEQAKSRRWEEQRQALELFRGMIHALPRR